MAKCLVTGGAGFMGSHIARELIALGHRVVILDDLSGGFKENIPVGCSFIQGSILDVDLINFLFLEEKFDYIYHLAAYAAEGLSHFIKRFNYENNLIGSVNLINASVNNNVKCFLFTSSIAVYGENQLPMDERLIPYPEDSYGIAKLSVEKELEISNALFGINYIIFRPHNVYGEHQNIGDKYRNVVGIFMNQILQNKPLTVFGDGSQTRAFTYIQDIAPLIANSVFIQEAYNNIFNIGAEQPYSVNMLVEKVCISMGVVDYPVLYLPARKEVKDAFSSHSKLKIIFNRYQSHHSLDAGLNKMALWVKKTGSRQSNFFKNIEINKNLPISWVETNIKGGL